MIGKGLLRNVWAVLFDPQLSSIDPAQPVRKTHEPALAPAEAAAPFVNPFPSLMNEAADRGLVPPGSKEKMLRNGEALAGSRTAISLQAIDELAVWNVNLR